ncbi:proton channel OtopLc-like [Tigriopus californicus]|uniref:proton channel OtopLc-like n=1 Tax=Tigriopus californicus TaxID=6832 RepID=UPI0027D9D725|nr:proton channel OtopLc-like [Tigriopus californicus]
MYGKFLVLLMLAFCLIEVMDNNIRPLAFQGIYMMYLYIGSIVAIMCIYITVLLDNCPSLTRSNKADQVQNSKGKIDPETGSVASFGTLRRAHIDRKKVSRTSFYLRVGALVFGLGTLIFTGLEIAMHATMENTCVDDILIAHPVLQALFTFLQMHFLFVNSQVIVERFGLFARFGFMHLVATNLCLWIRTIIWESANEWIHHIYRDNEQNRLLLTGGGDVFASSTKIRETPLALGLRAGTVNYGPYTNNYFTDRSFTNVDDNEYEYVDNSFGQGSAPLGEIQAPPSAAQFGTFCNNSSLPIAKEHLKYVISLYQCFNDNALGKLWTSSMPYLFPFIIEYRIKVELHFSLIAAAVTYIMWKNVGNDKIQRVEGKKIKDEEDSAKKRRGYWRVDCQSASKGLFLGLLCLVGGIIILIIFFVMKDNAEFSEEMFWIFVGMEIAILGLAILGCLGGFVQMQKLSHSFHKPYDLDNLLSSVTVVGAYVYAIFSMIAAGMDIQNQKHMVVFIQNGLLLIQVTLQGLIMTEAGRRICSTRMQQYVKPGRQLITFLLFANITLWIIDTFMTHSWITQGVQLQFYGLLAWGIISRISIPLLVFYRFHSCVVLVEIWKNTYRTKESF